MQFHSRHLGKQIHSFVHTNQAACHTTKRFFTDKILIGSSSALLTCATTLSLFHLMVTPVSSTIALATIATATASGALCVIDGGSEGGTSFGSVVGVFIGAMGGFYAKSQKEPWRKEKPR